ncbi:hypothetical protein CABS02_14915 [Colletotrichum abscissum]|uniref:Uncharacterized protein n=1 Tax=Colletotrichum abscissum TaxID=1671311 RepID=A0A9P9X0E3_9PEZI|nr:hypothetical protein CABS02_14915 [Colletotrichum abscissum]
MHLSRSTAQARQPLSGLTLQIGQVSMIL